jgi:hypothetical protein
MNDLSNNGKLKWLLLANFLTVTCVVFDYNVDLRETLELVPYPNQDFKQSVIQILLIDLGFCYVVERALVALYLRTFVKAD